MRLVRFLSGDDGVARSGSLLPDGRSAAVIDGDPLRGGRVTDRVLPVGRLLAPVVPTDLLCIGLNYRAHARESGGEVPDHPMLFIKASNSLQDPGGPIVLPVGVSDQVDYEAELVVVVGRDAKDVPPERALDYVYGYTCGNDVSARDWQKDRRLNGGQFARGKSFDTFAPIGPWVVTADEVPDPGALGITCRVNGEVMQRSTTADLIFDVRTVVSSLSRTMTVRAGSVIFTGTPEGVGMARTPPRFLRGGDVVEVEIERLGVLSNPVL